MYNQEYPQDNKPGFWTLFLILFLIVAVSVTGYMYLQDREFSIFQQQEQEEEEKIEIKPLYTMTVESDATSTINYTIKQNSQVIVTDKLSPNILEQFTKAEPNTTYRLEMISDEYYYNAEECDVYERDITCKVSLKKKADINMTFTNNILRLHINNGIVQQPLLCISWSFDIYIVRASDYQSTTIPDRMLPYADICYGLDGDINDDKDIVIEIDRIEPRLSEIRFMLIDQSADQYGIQTYEIDTGIPDMMMVVEI